MQCVTDGGLLAVTCTDLAVLAGNNTDTCFAKYGSMPTRGPYCHELAVRIVLASLQMHAGRFGRYIEPLISLQIDFYVRMFVRVRSGKAEVKQVPSKLAYVLQVRPQARAAGGSTH